ncbi:MAG: ethanolamine utilization protein EutN [Acidobacteria bacterium]|nr:MAG: ethanolamine utilization protein EutN [Acidobacteriota bacterium]
MILARVVGRVVATQKDRSHTGAKILQLQPIDPEGRDAGEPFLAFDGVDAGPGDRVLVTLDGWSASWTIRRPGAAVDAAVIGVVDTVELA